MAKTNTRKYLIYGSIATIVGVLAYYIWKGSKKDDKPKDETPAPDNDGNQKDGNIKDNGGGATPPIKDCTNNSTLKSENAIRKFQYYVINTKGDKTILLPDNDDGIWGCKTRAAWDKYGADYKKSLGGETPEGGSAVAGITTQNKDNFNKLAASFSKPFYTTASGIRYFILKFYDPSGTKPNIWTIRMFEQASMKDKGTTYAIIDHNGNNIQTGYYTNAGKNLRATTGRNAPYTAPTQPTLAKAISAVLKLGEIRKWL
jgi:hypothetical protein